MDNGHEVRRNEDGSIDIAFYAAYARRLRRQARSGALCSLWHRGSVALEWLGSRGKTMIVRQVLARHLRVPTNEGQIAFTATDTGRHR